MILEVPTMRAAAEQLDISHTELYGRIKLQKLFVETFYRNNTRAYILCTDRSELKLIQSTTSPGKKIRSGRMKASKNPSYYQQHVHARLIDEWLEWYSNGDDVAPWSENYKKDQLRYMNHYFQKFPIVSRDNLKAWLAPISKVKVPLRQNMHKAVASFARFLTEAKGLMTEEEYAKIQRAFPKKHPQYQPTRRMIYKEQLSRVFGSIDALCGSGEYKRTLMKAVVILLGTTALRISELCGLRMGDIRFSEDKTKAKLTVLGKGNKVQTITFPSVAQHYLLEYLRVRPQRDEQMDEDPERVFWVYCPTKKGYTILKKRCLSDYICQLSDHVGFKFTSHTFRHATITNWQLDDAIPEEAVQKTAGHSDINTTRSIYTHIRDEDVLGAIFDFGWKEFGLPNPKSLPASQSSKSQSVTGNLENLVEFIANLPPEQKTLLVAKLIWA